MNCDMMDGLSVEQVASVSALLTVAQSEITATPEMWEFSFWWLAGFTDDAESLKTHLANNRDEEVYKAAICIHQWGRSYMQHCMSMYNTCSLFTSKETIPVPIGDA